MMYDGIIVGGGHAGIEAALAMVRMQQHTLLISGNLSKVASLPCNPSIGGPAKGIVVREIDALGGQMAKSADATQIQMKMLNASKGPAVRALRAQIDKLEYPKFMLEVLKKQEYLTLLEAFVESLWIEGENLKGVILSDGTKIPSKTVIITTGTYLNSDILMGKEKTKSGPIGEPTTFGISKQLKDLGFEIIRLKTGTPPRIAKDSVDVSKMTIQPGDTIIKSFSHDNHIFDNPKEPCYLTRTTQLTKAIILNDLTASAMYGGVVEGVGPRYCPSIEDKIVKFSDKDEHQIFIEPESMGLEEYYVQGLSTSFPKDIQEKILHSIPGLEHARIIRYAYAIEYDAINPIQLKHSLETKKISRLFSAGQMNGTSGYEEAAGQGLMAGINAALKNQGKDPFVLDRHEAYIGVLIDDLVTKGAKEPYRLLTSLAEFRLLLRHDNAQSRLTQKGYDLGLVDEMSYQTYIEKQTVYQQLFTYLKETMILPNKENNALLQSIPSAPIYESMSFEKLLKRPEIHVSDLTIFGYSRQDIDVETEVETFIKYDGYIQKSLREAQKMSRLEHKKIPETISYDKISNMSLEAREKLTRIQPETVGQASRISGVSPVDISMLVVYIESGQAHL
jgi:tRNA uridine 5-carboxymethylaminomethyl modification enzyme